eukprot:TRINITY_DN10325_c0_g1_i1.p1 TRINITY_DN10325_c0_g1~~TRINITY_DN10325_c0_g1_i1.p1  ORF type:complete len:382 (+),score=78.58 TRINITY_DN10325_c0_g1_i1:116-1261(+)
MRAAVFATLTTAAVAGFVCKKQIDCGLNGDCVNGVCECDAGWVNPSDLKEGQYGCSIMKFKPVEDGKEGYRNTTSESWGVSPVFNPEDNLWHIFTAQFSGGCPVNSWKTNSYIFHAHGPTPHGPWTGSDVSVNIFAHNPQTILHPDGTWIMFFIGGWHYPVSTRVNCSTSEVYPPEAPDAGMPPTGDGCGPMPKYNAGCGIRMATSKSPNGPWDIINLKVSNYNGSLPVDCMKTNPAPMLLKNGSLVLSFNGGYCHGGDETIAVMIADSYKDPFRINHAPLKKGSFCEDPTIYETARGFHVLGHYLSGGQNSVYFFSEDLITWYESPVEPYPKFVLYSNGSNVPVHRMERPIVVMNGSVPLIMTSAVQVNNRNWGLIRYFD